MTRKLIDERKQGELTVKEAAERFNYTYPHLRRLIAGGRIKARRVGRTRKYWYVTTAEMEAYNDRNARKPSTGARLAALETRVAELERLQYGAPMKPEQVQQ